MQKRRKGLPGIQAGLVYLFLVCFLVIILYPICYCFVSSFKGTGEILAGQNFWPEKWNWENYVKAWEKANFSVYTKNSIFYAVLTMVLGTCSNAVCGYIFARGEFPGKNLFFGIKTAMLFLAMGSANMYPQLRTLQYVHLNKSLWGLILVNVCTGSVPYIFMLRAFILSIPKELDEAATIDGCSFMGIFVRIILPLIRPVLTTVAVLSFKGAWNDYLFPMVVTFTNPERRTLAVGLAYMQSTSAAADWSLMLPGAIISAVPLLLIFMFLNKYFVESLTAGAVKG